MKRCPSCNRTYTDVSLNFCLEDGTPLVNDVTSPGAAATIRYPPARDTSEPPPTEIYRPDSPAVDQARATPQRQQWAPVPPRQPEQWPPGAPALRGPGKKSNAIWW